MRQMTARTSWLGVVIDGLKNALKVSVSPRSAPAPLKGATPNSPATTSDSPAPGGDWGSAQRRGEDGRLPSTRTILPLGARVAVRVVVLPQPARGPPARVRRTA